MVTTTHVKKALEALSRSNRGSLFEGADRIVVRGTLDNVALVEAFREIISDRQLATNLGASTVTDVTGSFIDLMAGDLMAHLNEEVRFEFQKPQLDGVFRFLTIGGFQNGLQDSKLMSSAKIVAVAEEFDPFCSTQCEFRPWSFNEPLDQVSLRPVTSEQVNFRTIVRDLTISEVPGHIDFWVPVMDEVDESSVWLRWASVAQIKLSLILPSEVWFEAGELKFRFAGARRQVVNADLQKLTAATAMQLLGRAARWLLESQRETSIRHTLLAAEIAREWPGPNVPWSAGVLHCLQTAFDGAQLAYRAHLHERSSEMLKSLADLRKAMNEETNKIAERTFGLSSNLWRDMAVVLAAMGLRAVTLINQNNGTLDHVTNWFLMAVAVYMGFSYWITSKSNQEFIALIEEGRSAWYRKIHTALPRHDFDDLSTVPLGKAVSAYNRAKGRILNFYLVIMLSIVALIAYSEWGIVASSLTDVWHWMSERA